MLFQYLQGVVNSIQVYSYMGIIQNIVLFSLDFEAGLLLCQVRAGDELAWPPLMTGSKLGGAAPPAGAIDVLASAIPCHTAVGKEALEVETLRRWPGGSYRHTSSKGSVNLGVGPLDSADGPWGNFWGMHF